MKCNRCGRRIYTTYIISSGKETICDLCAKKEVSKK